MEIFFELAGQGTNNINLVTADHFIPGVAEAIQEAKKEGFSLANVHFATNYNAYMQLEELLEYCSPDIIVGDFNMFTEDIKEHKYIWSPNYNASIEFKDYISFPNENATFDHMLLKPTFKFTSIKTVEGMSDHSAIIYTIEKE